MAEAVRIGIIGVGQIGKHHLRNYQEIAGANIVAIADIDEPEADRVGKEFDIPDVYYNLWDMIARDDIEAVDVCLHNNLHMPATVAALQAGKHVYCEKPMAGAYIDAVKMLETANELGKKLSIQLSTLYSNEAKAAKALIDAGKLGKIYHARSTGYRRRGRPFVDGYGTERFVQKEISSGGALYDMGVYHISQILYLLGNPDVQTITGSIYQETGMDEARQTGSGYNVEELGTGYVRLAEGITMDIIESWAINLNQFEGSSIAGSEGGVRLEPFGYFHNIGDLELESTADLRAFAYRLRKLRANSDAYNSAQHHWVAALQGRVDLLPTAEVALNTMLISEGIYLSHQLGREVTPEEVKEQSVSTSVDKV
ncbi:Gfo/Idh/MocA family protein [Chloroflexota bacterium]